jgi:hypothetical protein
MIAFARRLPLVVGGIGIAAGLMACGNNVTGPVTWRSVVTETVSRVPQSSNSELRYDKLTGSLNDSHGHAINGTRFQESCNRLYVGGVLKRDWNCLATVYTGPHFYVAGGHADGLAGELPVLADPRTGGAFFISFDESPVAAPNPRPFGVKIVVQPGGG